MPAGQGWTKFFGGSVPNPSSDTCLSKNDFNNHPTPTLNSVGREIFVPWTKPVVSLACDMESNRSGFPDSLPLLEQRSLHGVGQSGLSLHAEVNRIKNKIALVSILRCLCLIKKNTGKNKYTVVKGE